MSAQNEAGEKKAGDFNQWSFELAGGFNKPQRPLTAGYSTSIISPYTVDLGVRYMFNNKFGLKADFGFNSFTGNDESIDFDTKYYRADIQGVANLGRIMNFENWTNTCGLLGHADEIGRSEYNDKLSNTRASNMKNTLVKANIEPSRLTVIAAGEDTSVDIDSENTRKLVRRVTFKVK